MVDPSYLDAIKQFEGYTAEARWDYAQNSNGYGTRARYAGEVIDKAEADRRFSSEVQKAAEFVDKFAPNLDEGSKAALTSLTYNAGTAWSKSGLGEAVSSGDLDKARSLFLQYNKAGGNVVDGLVQRRLQEVSWFGQGNPAAQGASAGIAAMAAAASASAIVSSSSAVQSSGPVTASNPTRSILRMASSDFGVPALSTVGSDQVMLSLLSHMADTSPGRDRDDNNRRANNSDRKLAEPDLQLRTG
ncbi:MAG: glycoside hydrolase family protein [Proteobacteria bacterium]|nr:glycoside hydrolase family protein [Pseudomonadota bacterium]